MKPISMMYHCRITYNRGENLFNSSKIVRWLHFNHLVAVKFLSLKQQHINVSFDIKFISRKWKKDIFVPIQMFVCGHVCVLLCCRLVYNDKGMVISKQIDVLLVTYYRREIFGVHNFEVVLMCVIGETKRKNSSKQQE